MAIQRSIESQLTQNTRRLTPEAKSFFRLLVSKTWSFWESLASWIATFESEMCALTPGDPETHKKQIWNLICWMLHSMLREMGARRSPGQAAQSIESANKLEIGVAILRGTLAAHKFMDELKDHNFGRHPIFAATMVEFLITTKAPYLAVQELNVVVARIDSTTRMLQGNKDREGGKKGAKKADS